MKVGVARVMIGRDSDVNDYFDFLERALTDRNLDLFVGPDYALSHNFEVYSPSEVGAIFNRLRRVSIDFPDCVIVPGTMSYQISDIEMIHAAIKLKYGRMDLFSKQNDHGEGEVARLAGLSYRKGDDSPAVFEVQRKKAVLYICGDRGRNVASNVKDAELEIILSHDKNAGFHIGITTPRNPRHIILSDSFGPLAQVQFYDGNQPRIISPVYDSDNLRIYKI